MFDNISFFLAIFLIASCVHKTPMTINHDNITPGTSVNARGKTFKLHSGSLVVGDNLLDILKTTDTTIPFKNKVTIVSVVPSIDTKVCEEQTHILGESKKLNPEIDRVVISRDLPMAHKRFASEANLENLSYVSDYKTGSFGKKTGLLIEETALLARGVIVIDAKGTVRYMQFVSELPQLPDMDKAFAFANSLVQ